MPPFIAICFYILLFRHYPSYSCLLHALTYHYLNKERDFFIHSYPDAILGFLFVIELAEKLYKLLHTLSVGFF
ncbi:hypothetical protein BK729_06905 [Bacillus thuringiensis serovar wratislaviensis]|nr:hypothetical protein BK729_06905 [Bacillus thuringiensis serovar wratislaviensis]